MKITVHAVGRMKTGPERELADRYFERFAKSGPAVGLEFAGIVEIPESRGQSADERRREEAQKLQAQLQASGVLILLDERGKSLSSEDLAARIGQLRDGVRWEGDQPVRVREVTLSLTFDHRAVDGAPAAEYLRTVEDLLNRPLRLLVD